MAPLAVRLGLFWDPDIFIHALHEASPLQTKECLIDARVLGSALPVVGEGNHVCGFAHNALNLVTATGTLNVSCKGPFAYTPVLNLT